MRDVEVDRRDAVEGEAALVVGEGFGVRADVGDVPLLGRAHSGHLDAPVGLGFGADHDDAFDSAPGFEEDFGLEGLGGDLGVAGGVADDHEVGRGRGGEGDLALGVGDFAFFWPGGVGNADGGAFWGDENDFRAGGGGFVGARMVAVNSAAGAGGRTGATGITLAGAWDCSLVCWLTTTAVPPVMAAMVMNAAAALTRRAVAAVWVRPMIPAAGAAVRTVAEAAASGAGAACTPWVTRAVESAAAVMVTPLRVKYCRILSRARLTRF